MGDWLTPTKRVAHGARYQSCVRPLAVLVLLAAACADWQRRALTDPYRADQPLIHEQALVGLATDGRAAAVQLIDAEGEGEVR